MSASASVFVSHQVTSPLVIAAPHVGTYLPPDIAARMNDTGLSVNETDFNVHRLFDFAAAQGASTLWATHSRYVIDLNRAPDSSPLYPGRFETPLCPLTDFDLNPIYKAGQEPDQSEINRRRQHLWWPYHAELERLLEAARETHGFAILIDAHSIRPEIPTLFSGRLPDLNFGTDDARTVSPALKGALESFMAATPFSTVLDGRFKGGYTTRAHGRPEDGIHALQIEIVQDVYLDMSAPQTFDPARAAPLSETLSALIEALLLAAKKAN
ncbi:MAG: N-formylglutamate deformylase [Asticcacaulis sp.]